MYILYIIPFVLLIIVIIIRFKPELKYMLRKILYLSWIMAYIKLLNSMSYMNLDSTHIGISSKYWFVFIGFIGTFVITYILDIILISDKNITEIGTTGIKLSESSKNLFRDQTNYLNALKEKIRCENKIIQNIKEYVKVDGYELESAYLKIMLEGQMIYFDELQLLENILQNYFNIQKLYSVEVNVYDFVDLNIIQEDLKFNNYQFHKLKKNIINNKSIVFNEGKWNIFSQKYKQHYILCFGYHYQFINSKTIIVIHSEKKIINDELSILSNILRMFELYLSRTTTKILSAIELEKCNCNNP